ncbi:MAG: DUF3822 family protein [Bacteroidetes bacterium]|jgi:hypothetical protein|nr:DUF3822 family protein [Bacteroidota bacterium]
MAETAVQEFKSSSWDDSFVGNYKLIISLAAHGIHFAVVNQISAPMYLRYVPNSEGLTASKALKSLAESEPILQHKYDKLEILLSSDPWLAVPNSFITRGKEGLYMETLFDTNTMKDEVFRDEVRTLDLSVLFCVPQEVQTVVKEAWPERRRMNFTHIVSPVMQIAHKLHIGPLKGKPAANVELFSDYMIYTLYQGGKLRFVNRYKVTGAADVLYFLMKVNETLGIHPQQVITYATGSAPMRAEVEGLLAQQFKHYVAGRRLFPASTHLNEAGFYLDEFSYLLIK